MYATMAALTEPRAESKKVASQDNLHRLGERNPWDIKNMEMYVFLLMELWKENSVNQRTVVRRLESLDCVFSL